MTGGRMIVVVPTYNEAENLGWIVGRLLTSVPGTDVLVVDDGSPDGTGRIADEIAAREPRVAAYFLGGLFGKAVDGLRFELAERVPRAILLGSRGQIDEASVALRTRFAPSEPAAVGPHDVRRTTQAGEMHGTR